MESSVHFQKLKHCSLAYRKAGSGRPLLLIHGYPLNGLTFRHVIPTLAQDFTCYTPDLLGAGETDWASVTDFSFTAQAETLKQFADAQGWSTYSVVGHDTGGTIARKLALIDPARVQQIALIGTEIPEHRPPWIELFQKTSDVKRTGLFRTLMKQKWFRHSAAAFKGCFYDRSLIDGEFYDYLIAPAVASEQRVRGLIHYLQGIDWQLVDSLKTDHASIVAPTILIWGADDTVFPVDRARAMVPQFHSCRDFVTIARARLFVHEEHPAKVAEIVRDFMVHGRSFGIQ